MRRESLWRFPRHQLQRKPLVSDPGMHHGTCVTHVPWSMSGSLTHGGRENGPGIPGACATSNFTYLVRGPWYVACQRCQRVSWHGSIYYDPKYSKPMTTVEHKTGFEFTKERLITRPWGRVMGVFCELLASIFNPITNLYWIFLYWLGIYYAYTICVDRCADCIVVND